MPDFDAMRACMVACQIRPANVADPRLIEALARVPRERFVPDAWRATAYVDEDLPLSAGRYLMEPAVFARLVAHAPVRESDTVLDVGCATGYSTAVLGLVAQAAIGVEGDAGLAETAGDLLVDLGIDNAVVVNGASEEGYAAQAPYDVIVLGGAVDDVPQTLQDQMAEGGRLVAVLRGGGGAAARRTGKATRLLKTHGRVSRRTLFDAAVPPLPGFERSAGFVF